MAPRYEHAHHGSTPTAPQVHFYDFLARAMVRTVTLSEWPTALAACAAAPIVAVGGASGGVRLAAHPFDASDNALFAPADMARYLALPSYQCRARLCMLLPKSPDHHPSPGDARQQCALPSLRGRQPALHRLGGRGRAVEPAPLLRRAPTARAMAATASATRQPRRPLPPRPRRPCRLCALGHMMWTRRGADGTFVEYAHASMSRAARYPGASLTSGAVCTRLLIKTRQVLNGV